MAAREGKASDHRMNRSLTAASVKTANGIPQRVDSLGGIQGTALYNRYVRGKWVSSQLKALDKFEKQSRKAKLLVK